MTALILAAGIASRLRPLTDTVPKALLSVGGIPLLERTLSALQSEKISEVVIVTGYLHEMIENFVESHRHECRISFVHNQHYRSTNNNYSLWLAKPLVYGKEIVILDADILFDRAVLAQLLHAPDGDALVVRRTRELGDEEVKVQCDGGGYVLRIGKEIDPTVAVGESLGIEKFTGPTAGMLFSALDRRKGFDEFYEASFQEVIDAGARILAVDCGRSPCIEIDTPEDLKAAQLIAQSMPASQRS